MTKTVCIIGAGPSGLVAAKSLLHNAPPNSNFEITIFDGQPRIGGLWPTDKNDGAGLVHPLMLANQSRHTMYFSDFAWKDDAPQIPRAWQFGGYLEQYRQRYCKDVKLRLGCRVEKADLRTYSSSEENHSWTVQTQSKESGSEEHVFDYLVIASGFFGRPAIPAAFKDGPFEIPVIHSSGYKSLEQLLGDVKEKSGKILVVGGQLSGVEIAGTIATDLSSAVNSPDSRRDAFIDPTTKKSKFSIHHLVQRPAWILPLIIASNPAAAAPPFIPLDLIFQNLANRPPGPLTNVQGHVTIEAARFVNSLLSKVLGTDQAEFSPELTVQESDFDSRPFIGIADTYMDFVRSGMIEICRGKLASLSGRDGILQTSEERIDDIAAVVLATGFEASSSLSFLSKELRNTLSVAPEDLNNTVALAFHNTYHPAIPNLGFIGFYRSPYWGVMEMQARVVAELFSAGGHNSPSLPLKLAEALKNDTTIDRTLALRTDPRASQFPMGDYSWLMQEFGNALGIERTPHLRKMPTLPPAGLEMNVLTTARYPSKNLDDNQKQEIEENMRQTESTICAGINDGLFVSRAIFRSLLGEWRLERELISRRSEQPSGWFRGTAKFLIRAGTADGREAEFAKNESENGDNGLEYLYIEEGEFSDESRGLKFNATRRYVWRYTEKNDKLSVWFNKTATGDERKADYLFHEIDIIKPTGEGGQDGWKAKGSHLCVEDMYNVQYNFKFQAVNLKEWRITYTVDGPKKDYTIDGVYRR
ncbi:hypothetical protein ABW20_dc0103584 [Dactylellina cionopaga]|nr:hypothetical protein ABW20_dc0103584 [Dactylellina cionopaga]